MTQPSAVGVAATKERLICNKQNQYNSKDFGIVLWYTITVKYYRAKRAAEIFGNHNPNYLRELAKQGKIEFIC